MRATRRWRSASLPPIPATGPLYEVENGKTVINYKPRNKVAVSEWLKSQGRFRHLFRPANQWLVEEIQAKTDELWEQLLKDEANSAD